jgi:hypothetical protein
LACAIEDFPAAIGDETVRFEQVEVFEEFFAVEIREGASFVWVHVTSD